MKLSVFVFVSMCYVSVICDSITLHLNDVKDLPRSLKVNGDTNSEKIFTLTASATSKENIEVKTDLVNEENVVIGFPPKTVTIDAVMQPEIPVGVFDENTDCTVTTSCIKKTAEATKYLANIVNIGSEQKEITCDGATPAVIQLTRTAGDVTEAIVLVSAEGTIANGPITFTAPPTSNCVIAEATLFAAVTVIPKDPCNAGAAPCYKINAEAPATTTEATSDTTSAGLSVTFGVSIALLFSMTQSLF